jgi:hypothetical protein
MELPSPQQVKTQHDNPDFRVTRHHLDASVRQCSESVPFGSDISQETLYVAPKASVSAYQHTRCHIPPT